MILVKIIALHEHVHAVEVLLENDTRIERDNSRPWNALYECARLGNIEMLQIRFKHGADIQARDRSYTLVHH